MVSVSPLHRRRGVLTSLMRRQLGELAAGGEAVAALWASDPVIYGRYGYGLAAWRQAFTVDSPASAFGPHGRALLAAGGVRPAPGDRPGGGTGGGAAGYSLHRTASSHADFVAAGTVTLQDLAAVTPAACAGLWRHLLDLDLITTWPRSTGRCPTRSRTCSPTTAGSATVGDALWVRVVDLPRALAARAFAAPVDLLLEVTDELLVANAVRWWTWPWPGGSSSTGRAPWPRRPGRGAGRPPPGAPRSSDLLFAGG